MQNSQMKEGQSEHDEHYGYGHLRVDLLIDALGNSTDESSNYSENNQPSFEEWIGESIQVRRSTARVPPVSSTNPRE